MLSMSTTKIDQYHNEVDIPVKCVVLSFYLVGLIIYQQSTCEHGLELEIAPNGFKNVTKCTKKL